MPNEQVNAQVTDAVTINNVKTIGEQAAFSTGLSMQNAVAHQQSMQAIQQAATGAIVKRLIEVDITEAVAVLKATSGNEVASQISALLAAVAGGQQQVKAAQTTPPMTP